MNRYLARLDIRRYGAFEDKSVGPFGPGLNVVYGPNEAGKSTVASFIGGVLFGWEEARGVRNTYRPADGQHRAGRLVFADADGSQLQELERAHNEDGLVGDSSIVSDLDYSTYRTMFSLSSDELRSLNNTSEVTARLLTAGSGTGSSPASAFVEIEQRIAERLSKTDESGTSLIVLGDTLEAQRDQAAAAGEVVELCRQEDRERNELAASRKTTSETLSEMNARLERLNAARARIASLDEQLAARDAELDEIRAERGARASGRREADKVDARLLALDSAAERSLRDKLDQLAEEQGKLQRVVDNAQQDSAVSTAAYEALVELNADPGQGRSAARNRTAQAVVSVALPAAFVAAGILVFIHGRQISSLSFTALGVGLLVLAFFLAAAAIVMLFRPGRREESMDNRLKDAQWVMLQDKKKLDSSLKAKAEVDERLAAFLESAGLSGANGSVREARALLDDAREARAAAESDRQRAASLDMREAQVASARAALLEERAGLFADYGLSGAADFADLDALIRDEGAKRDALSEAYDDMNLRFGELDQRLRQARADRAFDAAKADYQQTACRLREGKNDLVTLFLAKRMLEKSIVAWESRSQPEVYVEASRLFGLITDGAWQRVSMTADGRMVAVSAAGESREVRHLSLGTCQQLYLSLRIAMLLHARSVGRSIPVLADDVLVHFDARRRRAAARALAELAAVRQVIIFTCHEETVEAFRAENVAFDYLELARDSALI